MNIVFGALAFLFALVVSSLFPTTARALFNGTYDINPLNFAAACAPDCGDVTISGDGTAAITIGISITGSNLQLHGPGGASGTWAVALNLASALTQPPANVTVNSNNGNLWFTNLDLSPNGGAYGSFNVGIVCAGVSAGDPCGTQLNFTLTNTSSMSLALNDKDNFLSLRMTTTGLNTQGNVIGIQPTGFATLTTQAVPGPVAGAGLPAIVLACGGLLVLARRRRRNRIA
jgi:hypothetical protein